MRTRTILSLALALVMASLARAEATPEARAWLDQLAELIAEKPFRMEYVMGFDGMQGETQFSGDATGDLLQVDSTHLATNIAMTVGGEAMGDATMTIRTHTVCDGEFLWAEMNMVDVGMEQVAKISLAELAALQEQQGGLGLGQSSMYMDPISQIEALVSAFDVELLEVSDGKVQLSLAATEETSAQLGAQLEGVDTASGVLTLEESNAAPVSLKLDIGGQVNMSMRFTSFEQLETADIPEGSFQYAPEPDAQVMDLGEMIRSSM